MEHEVHSSMFPAIWNVNFMHSCRVTREFSSNQNPEIFGIVSCITSVSTRCPHYSTIVRGYCGNNLHLGLLGGQFRPLLIGWHPFNNSVEFTRKLHPASQRYLMETRE